MSAAIDFLRPRRVPWIGLGLLVLGVAALAISLGLSQRWAAQRADHEAAARLREEAALQALRAASKPPELSADQRRVQRVAPQLRQPWLPALRLIENATQAPVFLLGLAIDPASGVIRLDGEAPTFEQVVAYMSQLDEPGLMGPAELRSHEQALDPTGRSAVRFTIVTRWSAP